MAARTKAAAPPAAPALGGSIDNLFALKEKKKNLTAALADVDALIAEAELDLVHQLDDSGQTKAGSARGSVSIREEVVPTVEDWDKVWAYIGRNKAFHLIQRRMSNPAWREALEQGKKIPGIKPFKKRSLSVTASK